MPPESSIPLTSRPPKPPRLVFSEETAGTAPIFAFPPNRETLGGTSYLIVEKAGNLLIDCPAWDENTRSFLESNGGVKKLAITHRGGMAKVHELQTGFGCEVIVQEQEAYLLPNLTVTTFQASFAVSLSDPQGVAPNIQMIWTPGHSPGSSCVYYSDSGILFSGRHLIPNAQGDPVPLRTAKTFHWIRQIRNVQKLLDTFNSDTLRYICPGSSIGFLRGKFAIDHAYSKLAQLDLTACLELQPLL